jgi:molecular chaperone HscB
LRLNLKKVQMRRINQYKKLFQVEKPIDLKELKSTYRSLVKEWHPDKFQDLDKKALAEQESVKIIDGYHFLVSIAPQTRENNLEEYTATIMESRVIDYQHKSMLLEVSFADGNTYEYFGVNRKLFLKFLNAKSINNFGKRHIFKSFLYRKSKRTAVTA